ncbi:MAG TPA: type II toxin-antitoxin system VapC family toxin [Candidatus Binatia bacterium]|nr:type II toxin-antitoxin system VapC family toxin [Candidatus Binatia bacterium]
MNLLIDTHCWLWMQAEPERLANPVREILTDPATGIFLSAASVWEMSIKIALGKLRFPGSIREYVLSRNGQHGISRLPITQSHALQIAQLPAHHRDPFDRMLVAQAQVENLPILTSDAAFRSYDVEVIHASR